MPGRLSTSDRITEHILRVVLVVVGMATFIWLMKTGMQIFLPFVFAMVIGVVFAPMSDFFCRLGAPSVVGALAVLLIVLLTISTGVYLFYPVVAEFALRVPVMWFELQESLSGLKSTVENMEDMQSQVVESLAPGHENSEETALGSQVQVPTIADILRLLPAFAAQILVFVGILYFFLLTRTELYKYAAASSVGLSEKNLCRAEAEVSRYFLTITGINASFGVLVALMLSAYGMPNAVYWGVGAFLVNYVLYLGPISFAIVLLLGGLIVFDGPMSFLPAVTYMVMNMTEGQFVTPSLVGKQMSVNPLLVFTSLVFWLWMWGPLGGVIAIPLLVWFRQISKAMHASPDMAETSGRPRQRRDTVADSTHGISYGPAE